MQHVATAVLVTERVWSQNASSPEKIRTRNRNRPRAVYNIYNMADFASDNDVQVVCNHSPRSRQEDSRIYYYTEWQLNSNLSSTSHSEFNFITGRGSSTSPTLAFQPNGNSPGRDCGINRVERVIAVLEAVLEILDDGFEDD